MEIKYLLQIVHALAVRAIRVGFIFVHCSPTIDGFRVKSGKICLCPLSRSLDENLSPKVDEERLQRSLVDVIEGILNWNIGG